MVPIGRRSDPSPTTSPQQGQKDVDLPRRKVTFAPSQSKDESDDTASSSEAEMDLEASLSSEHWSGGRRSPSTIAAIAAFGEALSRDSDDSRENRTYVAKAAILSKLTRQAITGSRCYCNCMSRCFRRWLSTAEPSCKERVEAALGAAEKTLPEIAEDLSSLSVVEACEDFSFFVDHGAERLYMAVRSTNICVARDLWNDVYIALGYPPPRTIRATKEYRKVRAQYPKYSPFGSGHSLGGSIMHELAYNLEKEPDYAFIRVDVFNAGGSPLRRRYTDLNRTQFNSHRVTGDIISRYYEPPGGNNIEYEPVEELDAHHLGHFMQGLARGRALTRTLVKSTKLLVEKFENKVTSTMGLSPRPWLKTAADAE